MKDRNHYTDLANRCLDRITRLKKDSKNQELLDAYENYVEIIRPQLEDSGIELHKYDSRIENIIRSI